MKDMVMETEQSTYQTERLTLRPLRKSDAGLIEFYASDIRVAGPTRSIPHPLPPGATEAFIAQAMSAERVEDVWVIDGTQANLSEVVGLIGLEKMDRAQAEIGYWVAPAFWRMGIAREAVSEILAQNPQGSTTMFGEVFQDNLKSARLLTDLGFNFLGEAETFCVARKSVLPTWTYALKMDAG